MHKIKPKKVPSIDDSFIHINDVKIGQKVFFSPSQREPFRVINKKVVQVTVVELQNSSTKIKVSGNKYVSTEPLPAAFGADGGGYFGKNAIEV